jgi:hypothetical protein
MARPKKKQQDAPGGPGKWIVTFSDCMTLLLCFFVLLLTFSSFDDVELQKLAGIFQAEGDPAIFPVPREIKESSIPPVERVVHRADEGSGVPTDSTNIPSDLPRRLPVVLDDGAHKDRKVFYIPSGRLFVGRGNLLTRDGKRLLERVGAFMALVPCRVVIAENGPEPDAAVTQEHRLNRAWAVMQFFTGRLELPADRFNIAADRGAAPARLAGRRVVTVTLFHRDVY